MVQVLACACEKVFSALVGSGRKRQEDVGFRVLAAGNFLAHCTIRALRALNLSEFTALFTQTVHLAREMCLVKFGTTAVDRNNIGTIH